MPSAVPAGVPPGRAAPRSLIVTLYGAYGRAAGGWLSVALLVRLLADLGVDEPAVRSAVSRLKRRGLLVQERRDAAVGYCLSPAAQQILAAGDRRIFTTERAALEDGWVLVAFSVPESERSSRHVLRTELSALGFGTVSPGLWIGPARLADDTRETVARLGLTDYVELFAARHLAFGVLRERVGQWWDLPALETHYGAYVQRWQPVLRGWRRRRSPAPAAAFADYVGTLTDWRRLPYLDPGLPVELLPAGSVAPQAAEVFFALRERLDEPARAHVRAVAG